MDKFIAIEGKVAPLFQANIDTDQIIPKQFLTRIERTGYGDFLFNDWRFNTDGSPKPDFVLNQPQFDGASILAAGENFGCGSSREHAPQAIQKYGFKAVVAENFAEIFFGNCTTLGVPCATASRGDIARIAALIAADPNTEIVLDVAQQEIRAGGQTFPAHVRPADHDALINGRWDAIGELLDGMGAMKQTAAGLPYLAP